MKVKDLKSKLKIEYLSHNKLVKLEGNPRKTIDPDASKKLRKLIKSHGFQNPLQVYKENGGKFTILCGNHRFDAGIAEGIQEFPCIVYRGSRNKAMARAISDNKSSAWTEWDIPQLKELMAEIDTGDFDMELTGFTEDEIKEMFDYGKEGLTDADDVPDVPKKPKTKKGDLYQLGLHRILCGDATSEEDVKRLMNEEKADLIFTDPPYGVSYADKNKYLNSISPGNRIQTHIKNDHMTLQKTGELWAKSFKVYSTILADYSSYYICGPQGGDLALMMMMMMNQNGLPVRHTIIWAKNNHVLGRCDYNYKHEPILYGWINRHKFYKAGEQKFSVWEYDKPLKNDLHPTMKPVALIINAIKNSTLRGMSVIDFFGGSGSTLIASEQTGRKCYMMEIDEAYCDVIVKRWEDFTGKKGKLINANKGA